MVGHARVEHLELGLDPGSRMRAASASIVSIEFTLTWPGSSASRA